MDSNFTQFVKHNYERFSQLPGSQHIASQSSQLNLIELLLQNNPKNILDWGSGIGTLIPLYRFNSSCPITAFEKDLWCMEQLKKNTFGIRNLSLVNVLPENLQFDFIVIDDTISFSFLSKLLNTNLKSQVIFIEGWRNSTVAKLSLVILLNRISADFIRFNNRSSEFGLHDKQKAGSCFLIQNSEGSEFLFSWINRIPHTLEITELKNFLFSKLLIYKFLNYLRLGVRVRKAIGLKPKRRVKLWRETY